MTEIKYKLVDGEPVCVGNCPSFDSANYICEISRWRTHEGIRCHPGIKQQRDEARADAKESDDMLVAIHDQLGVRGDEDVLECACRQSNDLAAAQAVIERKIAAEELHGRMQIAETRRAVEMENKLIAAEAAIESVTEYIDADIAMCAPGGIPKRCDDCYDTSICPMFKLRGLLPPAPTDGYRYCETCGGRMSLDEDAWICTKCRKPALDEITIKNTYRDADGHTRCSGCHVDFSKYGERCRCETATTQSEAVTRSRAIELARCERKRIDIAMAKEVEREATEGGEE